MELSQGRRNSFRKLSRWFKKVTHEDSVGRKTHKAYRGASIYEDNAKLLAAEGSGTICLKLEELKAFNLDLIATNALLRLSVSEQSVKLYCVYRGRFILLKEQIDSLASLDNDPECLYWVSFEGMTRTLNFGKCEPCFENICFSFTLPQSNKSAEQYWMNKIGHYRIDTPSVIYSTRLTVQQKTVGQHSINLLKT